MIGPARPATADPLDPCDPGSAPATDNTAYTVLTFTDTSASCTWTPAVGVNSADVLVVAGGGSGAYDPLQDYSAGGAGGAGGLIYRSLSSTVTPTAVTLSGTVTITVGPAAPFRP